MMDMIGAILKPRLHGFVGHPWTDCSVAASSLHPSPAGPPAAKRARQPEVRSEAAKKKPLLPVDVKEYLLEWCKLHVAHPYPNETERGDICVKTNLTPTQVNNWSAPAAGTRATIRPELRATSLDLLPHPSVPPVQLVEEICEHLHEHSLLLQPHLLLRKRCRVRPRRATLLPP